MSDLIKPDKDSITQFEPFYQVSQKKYEDMMRLVEILSSAWWFGDWVAETANEREQERIMNDLGLWPTTEDEIVARTIKHENNDKS